MTLQELYDKWGRWLKVAQELEMSPSLITAWKVRGSIPFSSQLLIEFKTDGIFKAKREDDKGTVKQRERQGR